MECIYLILGKSGSGKTTIANALEDRYGYKQLYSYTTREPRYKEERGHTFVKQKDFDNEAIRDCVAFTVIKGNYYWATGKQVDESDIYVIDPKGVEFFKGRYRGKKQVRTIVIKASEETRRKRMERRGDSDLEIDYRILSEKNWFDNFKADLEINNDIDGERCLEFIFAEIDYYIKEEESKVIT